jgi:diadenosine tetraphosphatase ApaH/serine/threonine PP2A family protein phosphatase
MRIAIITDLHANREALEAVLAHAQSEGAQQHAFVGDLVGYGADPAWVVDTVREFAAGGAIVVQGNHDEAVVSGSRPTMHPDARHVVDWTRQRLDEHQLRFLARLPFTEQRDDMLFVHANAWAPPEWAYIRTRGDAVRSLQGTPCRHTFCGHMHEPRLYNLAPTGKAGEFVPVAGIAIPVPPHRQWLVIPGSAGQPRDGNPAACYALFDSAQALLTFHRVPYDFELAGAKIRAAELPQRLALQLADGD